MGVSQNRTHTDTHKHKTPKTRRVVPTQELEMGTSKGFIMLKEHLHKGVRGLSVGMEVLECMRVDRSQSQGEFNAYRHHKWMGVCTEVLRRSVWLCNACVFVCKIT